MELRFNSKQVKSLSVFFFNVAQGLIIGIFGLFITFPYSNALPLAVVGSVFVYGCLSFGLRLLE